jgi:hypothetical protein
MVSLSSSLENKMDYVIVANIGDGLKNRVVVRNCVDEAQAHKLFNAEYATGCRILSVSEVESVYDADEYDFDD